MKNKFKTANSLALLGFVQLRSDLSEFSSNPSSKLFAELSFQQLLLTRGFFSWLIFMVEQILNCCKLAD